MKAADANPDSGPRSGLTYSAELSSHEISRYARQLVLPEFGVKGQMQLRNTSFLVVGAGGLGCSAAIHLAGSGAGKLTIVDHDRIEVSNLHRQILYSTKDIGRFKAEVLVEKCNSLNPLSAVPAYASTQILTVENVSQLVESHDVILDCTDNVYARYLLNDACVLIGKPLVSASALKFEGQLTVYNWKGSVCRRCLFPDPKILQSQSCDDNGVMGPVPGIIGSLQAMEAIKLGAGMDVSFAGVQLHFDAMSGTFYRIRLRTRNPNCPLCGANPVITSVDDKFLGTNTCLLRQPDVPIEQCLPPESRVSVQDYHSLAGNGVSQHLLLDVRSPAECQICGFTKSLNIPMTTLMDQNLHAEVRQNISRCLDPSSSLTVIVLCRRGNDSQIAVHILRKILAGFPVQIKDLQGGLYEWKRLIDPGLPIY